MVPQQRYNKLKERVKAPDNGEEVAISQEMPEMRPFPGCIAELDGYTYTGIDRARVRFDTVEVIRRQVMRSFFGLAPTPQPQARRRTATAPNPHVDTSPEKENSPSSNDSDQEGHPSGPS